jgi:haloalkane dehalogenase
MGAMPRILLTNCLNSDEPGWAHDQLNALLASQLWKQGPFGFLPRQVTVGLYIIAENVPAECTVLEFPPEELFTAEIARGYDYLGIQAVAANLPIIVRMVELTRRIAPQTTIVIGGYGAASLQNPLPYDPGGCAQYLRANVDHVCSGDGVAFFRQLLGDPADAPVTQRYVPFSEQSLQGLDPLHLSRTPYVLAALGCPNGCEFCVTSAFYGGAKRRIAEPEQVVASIESALRRLGRHRPAFFVIYDEDYLSDRPYVLQVGELLRERDLYRNVSLWCFASVRSISQYAMEELVLNGIGTLFIGFESKMLDDDQNTYHQVHAKRAGRDTTALFQEFKRYGIMTVVSTVFGWDFHTPENIEQDIEYLAALQSPFYQIAPLTAYPGTPLFNALADEGRIYADFTWRDVCFWNSDVFKPAHFERGEIRACIERAYDLIYTRNGPTLLSMADIMVAGYRTLSGSDNPFLQQRARRLRVFADKIRRLFPAMDELAPSTAVAERVASVNARCDESFGRVDPAGRIVSTLLARRLRNAYAGNGDARAIEIPWSITRYPGPGSAPRTRGQHHARDVVRRLASSLVSNV